MSKTALPHLQCLVTGPSISAGKHRVNTSPVDFSPFMAWSGATSTSSISQNFGRQGDTATIVLVDDYNAFVPGFPNDGNPHFAIAPFSSITITDLNVPASQSSGILFSGLVTNPQWKWIGPFIVEWTLNCVDNAYYADTAISNGKYVGVAAHEIIVDITTKANCAINAATVSNGGHVYPAPIIPYLNLNYDNLSNHWNSIAKLSSQAAVFGWFVDYQRNLWFYPTNKGYKSGITVTDNTFSSAGPSYYECHIDSAQPITYEFDATQFYTEVLAIGTTRTVTFSLAKAKKDLIKPTDFWIGNGSTRSWPMSYVPDVSNSSLTPNSELLTKGQSTTFYLEVGGVNYDVVVNDGVNSGVINQIDAPFQVKQAANGTWTLQVTSAEEGTEGFTPGPGVEIEFWYNHNIQVAARAKNRTQISNLSKPGIHNAGVLTSLIKDTSLTTTQEALNRAQAQIQEYGEPQERINFYTDESFLGYFRVGQTFVGNFSQIPNSDNPGYALGLVGTFFIIQQNISFKAGGYRSCQITAVRVS
jgi:hypothetical protein